jgi:hypothetical protein
LLNEVDHIKQLQQKWSSSAAVTSGVRVHG